MELVRYRPGEAIRWLQTGAEHIRRGATAKGLAAAQAGTPDAKALGDNLKTAAGAIWDFSRGAYADLMHRQAEASEYVLHDRHFDVVRGPNIKSIVYDRVQSIELNKDRAVVTLEKGAVTIRPFAHLVAGKVKVPVGWSRNGIEVPFELLVEELAARCNVEFEEK